MFGCATAGIRNPFAPPTNQSGATTSIDLFGCADLPVDSHPADHQSVKLFNNGYNCLSTSAALFCLLVSSLAVVLLFVGFCGLPWMQGRPKPKPPNTFPIMTSNNARRNYQLPPSQSSWFQAPSAWRHSLFSTITASDVAHPVN